VLGTRVFLFGTLRHDPLLRLVAGRSLSPVPAVLPGARCDKAAFGDWPVLVADAEARAEGLLVECDADALARLDGYEAVFGYRRHVVTVETAEGPVTAQVWRPDHADDGSGTPWDLEAWVAAWGPLTLEAAADIMRQLEHARSRRDRARGPYHPGAGDARCCAGGSGGGRGLSDRGFGEGDVEVAERRHPYDGFFSVEEVRARFRRFDGEDQREVLRAVFRVTDAATVLPYDPVRDRILLVEQVRFGPLAQGDPAPWLLEPVAGFIDAGESPEAPPGARRRRRRGSPSAICISSRATTPAPAACRRSCSPTWASPICRTRRRGSAAMPRRMRISSAMSSASTGDGADGEGRSGQRARDRVAAMARGASRSPAKAAARLEFAGPDPYPLEPGPLARKTKTMPFHADLAAAVGNTPLIRLNKVSDATGCEILGKAEFMNPGQSVKDRAALFIIRDAIARGTLRPGGTIVEGTAGNTGIGLALVGASMGFRTVIVIPETQSQEKKDMLRLAGAELVEVPAVPYSNPDNYVRYSGRLAERLAQSEPNGAIWANQFDNTANRQAHVETTGPEIWEQTEGGVHGFTCAVGSGGTLAGVAEVLQPRGVKVALSDPEGSGLYKLYTGQEAGGNSITEGIGQGRITANLEGFSPDACYKIPDSEALPIVFDLLAEEGLCLGGSSGINVAGAVRMARDMGPGHTIVTILCDYGTRYQSKLFNPEFLAEKDLPIPPWMTGPGRDLPQVFEA
jgi:cysteine synthase A